MTGSAAEGVANGATASEDGGVEHTNVIFSGTLPAASGSVPQVLHRFSVDDLRTHAIEFYNFLVAHGSTPASVNADDVPRVALLEIPRTKMVRVVYYFLCVCFLRNWMRIRGSVSLLSVAFHYLLNTNNES